MGAGFEWKVCSRILSKAGENSLTPLIPESMDDYCATEASNFDHGAARAGSYGHTLTVKCMY